MKRRVGSGDWPRFPGEGTAADQSTFTTHHDPRGIQPGTAIATWLKLPARCRPKPGLHQTFALTPSGGRPHQRLPTMAARRLSALRSLSRRTHRGRSCCSRWSRSSRRNAGFARCGNSSIWPLKGSAMALTCRRCQRELNSDRYRSSERQGAVRQRRWLSGPASLSSAPACDASRSR